MIFNDIIAGLESWLLALPAEESTENKIIFPNVVNDDPTEGEYIKAQIIPGETSQLCLGEDGRDITEGAYQVDIFTPNGDGRSQLLDVVANHFKRSTVIEYGKAEIRVIAADMLPPLKNRAYYQQPINIRFRAYTPAR